MVLQVSSRALHLKERVEKEEAWAWARGELTMGRLQINDIELGLSELDTVGIMSSSAELKTNSRRASSRWGVAEFMRLEQQYIGDWKLERIVEAAGTDFDPIAARDLLVAEATTAPVVMFSFVDCPWCLLAKGALRAQISIAGAAEDALRVVELEELGREGKRLRAALAIATGRTSMPAIFINSRAIGGYTDGEPAGDEALCLAGSPGLKQLIEDGTFQGLLKSALASRDNRPRIGP